MSCAHGITNLVSRVQYLQLLVAIRSCLSMSSGDAISVYDGALA